jgi:uncharacterized protein GlcG (DUF336 family)
MPERFPLDLADPGRGPTASQAAGLTLAAARAVIAAAISGAHDEGVPVAVAVVDGGGQLVAFERMDAADLVTVTLAQDKAWTALMNGMPTAELAPIAQPGAEFFGYHTIRGGRTIIFAGGLPLRRGNVLVGAVGVSGGSADQDGRIVAAAAAAASEGSG